MKRITYIISLSLIYALLLTGCGTQDRAAQTPEETIETAFSALKELDMTTFNACTNNKVGTSYQLFSDLFRKKQLDSHQQLAQALMQELSWTINDVQIDGDTATADVTIRNKDFTNAVGLFVTDIFQKVNNQQTNSSNIAARIQNTVNEARNSPENLLPYLEDCTGTFTCDTTITLKKVNDNWQIQLDESLCNTLLGNLGSDNFSEDVEQKISAAEELLNRNLERWSSSGDKNAKQWAEQLEEKLQQVFQAQ